MTTLPQPGLPPAPGIFAAVFAEGGSLGVYARALEAGSWRPGDSVEFPARSEIAPGPEMT
jgi:MOSC domain-containing protein YiiM